MLINEQVREGGLPISDETIKMAKFLLPDGDQVFQAVDQFDTTIKLEMLLNQFHSTLYWLSIEEFFLMCLLWIFFLRSPSQMWFFLLNVPHLPRGCIGLQISRRVPKSHEIINQIQPRTDEEAQM